MPTLIALRFLLKFGHFIDVVFPDHEAKKIMHQWKTDRLPEVIGESEKIGGLWGIRSENIVCIHQNGTPQQKQGEMPGQVWRASGM